MAEIDAKAEEMDLEPAAKLSDPDYLDGDEVDGSLYGAGRNDGLLAHLAKMADERREEEKVASASPLTSWDSVEEPKMEKAPEKEEAPAEKPVWRKVFRDREGKLAVLKASKE